MSDSRLEQLRKRIDALDEQLQALLSERAECAQQVAEAKRNNGDDADFYRPEREVEVLRRVRERNKGPLSDNEVVRLFREIMSVDAFAAGGHKHGSGPDAARVLCGRSNGGIPGRDAATIQQRRQLAQRYHPFRSVRSKTRGGTR